LADYSSLSVRKLRDHLADAVHPLPSYRVGGKVLVRRSEFDAWMGRFRHQPGVEAARIVEEVLRGL
jgi:excisionase family DNA binding protein